MRIVHIREKRFVRVVHSGTKTVGMTVFGLQCLYDSLKLASISFKTLYERLGIPLTNV